eukprot:scaffold18613_cov48-Phaeocystis_antarctica.AAC.1
MVSQGGSRRAGGMVCGLTSVSQAHFGLVGLGLAGLVTVHAEEARLARVGARARARARVKARVRAMVGVRARARARVKARVRVRARARARVRAMVRAR